MGLLDFPDLDVVDVSKFNEAMGLDSKGKRFKPKNKKPKKDITAHRYIESTVCDTCPIGPSSKEVMDIHGLGGLGIMVVTAKPFAEEARTEEFGVGRASKYLTEIFKNSGIDLYRDCWRVNFVRCHCTSAKFDEVYDFCSSFMLDKIDQYKPKLIICMDGKAAQYILYTKYLSKITTAQTCNRIFPSHQFKTWVLCTHGVTYTYLKEFPKLNPDERKAKRPYDPSVRIVMQNSIIKSLAYLDKELPVPFMEGLGKSQGNFLLNDSTACFNYLNQITNKPNLLVGFDYETNMLSPFDKSSKVITCAFSHRSDEGVCIPFGNNNWSMVEQAYVEDAMVKWLASSTPKAVQFYGFEANWSKAMYGEFPENMVHDTQVGSHVLNCTKNTSALDFQVFQEFGVEYKSIVDRSNIERANLNDVARYNCLDSRYTRELAIRQRKQMVDRDLIAFFNFLTGTQLTLCEMSFNGVCIDADRFNHLSELVTRSHVVLRRTLFEHPSVQQFIELYGEFNPNSDFHKAVVLYDLLKVPCTVFTKGSRSTAEPTLISISQTYSKKGYVGLYIKSLLEYVHINTFLKLIATYRSRLDPESRVHSSYYLDVAETYRSTAKDPNMQNVSKRKAGIRSFRGCMEVCDEDEILLEVDYSGAELCGLAMLSGDTVLQSEILNGVNLHRFWASRLYDIPEGEITKDQRQTAKNSFVFPSIYGAGFGSIAYAMNMKISSVEALQNYFWKHYAGVKAWQNSVISEYNKTGGVRGATGFFRPGPLSTEQQLNSPIQGTTFHLLLDALPRIREMIRVQQMKRCRIVLQVHDSILFRCLLTDASKLVKLVTAIMISKRFPFQKEVPLSVEWEYGKDWGHMSRFNHDKLIATGEFLKC